jgi:hypothetical protein
MAHWLRLQESHEPLYTSNIVVVEWLTLMARRSSYAFAAERAKAFYTSNEFTILRPGMEEEQRAVALLQKYADQEVAFADCISFVLMRRAGIEHAFTFDRHFRMAGFKIVPDEAV